MASPDPIETAWEELLLVWEDQEAHGRFLALCSSLGRLEAAGTRYRAVLDSSDEERHPAAAEQIDHIVATAMAGLTSLRTPERPRSNPLLLLLALVVFLALVGGATWAMVSGP